MKINIFMEVFNMEVYFFSWQIVRRDNKSVVVDNGDLITNVEGNPTDFREYKLIRCEMLALAVKEYEEKFGTFDHKELFVQIISMNKL